MDLAQALTVFGYAALPAKDRVDADFATRFNALSSAHRQTPNASEYTQKIQALIEARDAIHGELRRRAAPKQRPAAPAPQSPTPQSPPQGRPSAAQHPPPGPARRPPRQPRAPTPRQRSAPPPNLWPRRQPPIRRWWRRPIPLASGLVLVCLALWVALWSRDAGPAPAQMSGRGQPAPRQVTSQAGGLLVRPYPWARVTARRGNTSVDPWDAPHREPRRLSPGRYSVEIRFADGGTSTHSVVISPGRVTALVVNRVEGVARTETR